MESLQFPELVQQWANDIAYKQFNVEEFREALPWLHLTRPNSSS